MADIIDVTWTQEPVSVEKLQIMAENQRKLRNLIPTVLYKAAGINKDTGVKILSGSTIAPPAGTRWINQEVYFGNFFSVGCNPIVIAQTVSATQRVLNIGVHGLGKTEVPTHVGFHAYLYYNGFHLDKGVIDAPITIQYIAMGW